MADTIKQSYVSPPNGTLEISVIRDAQPRVEVSLDLGIPNFTVFSMKIPLAEDQPSKMSSLIAEGIHVLLDEVASFMMNLEFADDIIVGMYANVLTAFKAMSNESATDKEQSTIGQDDIVKTFEGTFLLPQDFVNETQRRVVTGATKIKRSPVVRHLELTYMDKPKTKPSDAARVIREYRSRSLKTQPRPMYVIVYDQMGRPAGTIPVGPSFTTKLLQVTQKHAAIEFTPPMSFGNEQELKSTPLKGVPKMISVGGYTYVPEGVAGQDIALYRGPQDYLVKFPDGRAAIFPGRPTLVSLRRLNFPVPRNRFKWTLLPPPEEPKEEVAVESPEPSI